MFGRRRSWPRRGRAARYAVSPQWERWIIDNLARGAEDADIVEELASRGVPRLLARSSVRKLRRGEVLTLLREARRTAAQCMQIVELAHAHRKTAVPRFALPTAEEFYQRFWETSTPAIFTGWVETWPAMQAWTPASFARRFGDVEIEACTGRHGAPQPDINFKQHVESMTMREYVRRLEGESGENDLYLIANNRNSARPELSSLFDDIVLPPGYFSPPHVRTSSALWFGGGGTVTQLHHDGSNIMFCQVLGSKRFILAPPTALEVLEEADGVYNRMDPDSAPDGVFLTVDVRPGEALFIPAGWWHHVRSLQLSISLALNGFTRPNDFPWFKPGEA